jgi:hypothetical protein
MGRTVDFSKLAYRSNALLILERSSGTDLGDPKVDEHDIVDRGILRAVEEIVRLDISMNDPVAMNEGQCILFVVRRPNMSAYSVQLDFMLGFGFGS